ncbi:molybdenum cofactor guanylyltransferase [Salipaludibacillus agaradhaerens]|jgi:molybdopterin-guanine dinucleotide biosynthesis protein A|uniref:Probable molybdenum cofactor guanylyltransferase n=1 Tax=Salipaludibacillus agaradhaerens TaxID=76935 RepID=A0A9Q4FV49_SALAG|nr:molybdenum cofactor guanylyltransferase [Salipaludibacillus agaradhaerens]MCR6095400.1 molybdenum cofactor guanylyltransferase [Salipaludibacillus agaradhaerens]MCR6115042.1 molybdenum cofactor guanylyltransferase [Salipaludibacillus agaradhaerens]
MTIINESKKKCLNVTGIILAGGKSSRMGVNKALLPIQGDETIQRLTNELLTSTKSMIIVTNDTDAYTFLKQPLVHDNYVNKGPLAGIQAGLAASHTEWNFITACDMPFLTHKVVEILFTKANKLPHKQVIVPQIDGKKHPLSALYHASSLPYVTECLMKDKLRVSEVVFGLDYEVITEQAFLNAGLDKGVVERNFFNMNSREDYEQVMRDVDKK